MPRPPALLALLAALAATLVAVPSVSPAAFSGTTSPVDGSAQGGDPYFPWDGNGGYDVDHYAIHTTFTPKDGRLRGRTTVEATAGPVPLRSLALDLVLTPDWVKVDGRTARFAKPRTHELRVTPSSPVGAGSTFTVTVGYHGRPARVSADGHRPFVWSPGEAMAVGEPQIGAWWFAANETPSDKASFDVTIRVPRGQQALSNGDLVHRAQDPTWSTWRWRQTEPIVTYLAFFAAGSFEVRRSVVDARPTVYAVSKRLGRAERDRSFRLLERTPGVTRWLQEWLGRYPYGTNGGVVTGLWTGFALENAGRPTYPYVGGPGDRYNVSLVVHELAHQWFGNDVSLQRWRDIWINEGLASYAEWAYAEDHWSIPVEQQLVGARATYPADSPFWSVRLSDPGAADVFHEAVYERGAMTVAALRCRIGDEVLDTLLRAWLSRRSGGWGSVDDFRDLVTEVSGKDLDSFFVAWLDTPARPAATQANGFGGCV